MVRRSGIEGAEHQIPKMERRCGVRNSPPDGAEVRCAEHQIRVRCPALAALTRCNPCDYISPYAATSLITKVCYC